MPDKLPEMENWLTLRQAANQLNVHPTTLRRWAESGDILYMRTPGGHRRFSDKDVQRFAMDRRRLKSVSELEQLWAEKALTQTRHEIVQRPNQSWMSKQDSETREKNRGLGQRLLGLILQHLAGEESNELLLAEARLIGREYAWLGQEMGLSLTSALEASMFFRDNLLETALQLPETARVQPDASLRLMRRLNELLNAVHLAIAEVYESAE